MVIYETGMTEPERIAVLMEMAERIDPGGSYTIYVQMDLAASDKQLIASYQSKITKDIRNGRTFQKYCAEHKVDPATILPYNVQPQAKLHLTIIEEITGTAMMARNAQQDVYSFANAKVNCPYVDTDSDAKNLVIQLGLSPSLSDLRNKLVKSFANYKLKVRDYFNPHMTIGTNPVDTPTTELTVNPGFSSLNFDGLRLISRPA